MKVHISVNGVEKDDQDFAFIRCECGKVVGPVPGVEQAIDMAMEHAYAAAIEEEM